jgi:hypothetical protein
MSDGDENPLTSGQSRRPLFRPAHDHILRALLLMGGVGLALILALSGWYWDQASWQWTNVAAEQPVQFSHKHHVAQLGLDCRYCHTGVDKSSFAGLPPTETCMTCHSQIWTQAPLLQPVRDSAQRNRPLHWNRVTTLPDYVYFNHSAHVNRGVACVSCHGRIDQMPMTYRAVEMTMSWCLACHRDPDPHLVPASQVTNPVPDPHAASPVEGDLPPLAPLTAVQKARLTNCSVCHR